MIDGRKLLILDGPSASGKSTILELLLNSTAASFTVAQRITTRPKRKGDEDDPAYQFSDMASFEQMIEEGLLLEYKHYLFGMSYGLPVQSVSALLQEGKNVIGMINLGNANMVKEKIPDCFSVLITASLRTIEQRLRSRNLHTEEQIAERLGNASKVSAYEHYYDLVLVNENRTPEAVANTIIERFLMHQST
jgi:guanylate kinase